MLRLVGNNQPTTGIWLNLRSKMNYGVYKLIYKYHFRWYVRPLLQAAADEFSYTFRGPGAKLLACQKAQELNQAAGQSALAA